MQGVGLGEGDVDRVLETDWVCEKEGETVTVTEGVKVVVWEGELDAE